MKNLVKEYVDKLPVEVAEIFDNVKQIAERSASNVQETMWARLPTYSTEKGFVRLIAFKDHINIEAKAVTEHVQQLAHYKITPKGMLQLFVGQAIPTETLQQIFEETLN